MQLARDGTPAYPTRPALRAVATRPLSRERRQEAVALAGTAAACGEPDLSRSLFHLARTAPRVSAQEQQKKTQDEPPQGRMQVRTMLASAEAARQPHTFGARRDAPGTGHAAPGSPRRWG